MVFAEMFRQKMRREAREEGRREAREKEHEQGRVTGHKEADAAWREWNQRRRQAIVEGKPFDEPTPDFRAELIQRAFDGRAKPQH